MQDNPEGGELDPAEDVHRRCKNYRSVLSCMDERTREGYNRVCEVGIVHSGRDGKGPVDDWRRPDGRTPLESCLAILAYCSEEERGLHHHDEAVRR